MQGLPCLSNHCITDVLISIHLNDQTYFSEPIQLICKEVSLVEEPPAMSAFSFFGSLSEVRLPLSHLPKPPTLTSFNTSVSF